MHDIRDLISGSLHIERIVFACDIHHTRHAPVYSEETRTHYFLGALSGDRHLLLEIPSPQAANQPIDLLFSRSRAPLARSSDTEFKVCGPMVVPFPLSTVDPDLARGRQMLLHPLRECLQLGLAGFKPGSIRWNDDTFTAEFSDEIKKPQATYTIHFGRPGEVVPESVKEKYLADLLNPPADRPKRKVVTKASHSYLPAGEAPPPPPDYPPGSVEARILAHHAAKHEARMAKGIHGQMRRNADRLVSEIRFDAGIPRCIEFEYAPSPDLPLPFPHRIKISHDTAEVESNVPPRHMTIYALRVSEQPVDDSVFTLWNYLKEGTYVRGIPLANGRSTLADPKDQELYRRWTLLWNKRPVD
jgi:hypothetical protein